MLLRLRRQLMHCDHTAKLYSAMRLECSRHSFQSESSALFDGLRRGEKNGDATNRLALI